MTLAEKKKLQWEKERGTDVNALKKVSESERESREGTLLCHACYDIDPLFIESHQKDCLIKWRLTTSQEYKGVMT